MAGTLRRLVLQPGTSGQLLRSCNGPTQQQLRFAGDLPVKPNKYVEDWATFRENVEYTYRWDRKTWTRLGLWLFGFPYAVYCISVSEFNKSDKKYGREPRDFMGSVKKH
ncbi:hypothetical protein WJX73_000385 [Symbiochloris irregularis]|uniref:NADH dehydrogenase [ubiquinone] 1 beta subcomplex subunit 4 n=1 Tax=Symbiochloris irregularis TaxID=706552 RepID=A0AAW1NXK1_9CHLO